MKNEADECEITNSITIGSDDDFSDDFDPSFLDAHAKPEALMYSTQSIDHKNPEQLKPCHHINYDTLSTYIYPTNLQVREYQYNIVSRAFFHDTLVVLPTGLGKTFIASTVILNFYRWFPESKIVFMAPTRPLVAQQIKACCGITGIPPSEIAILLEFNRKNRQSIWDEKKIFFTTPQVVENDLKLGMVSPKSISLLVIDEAHRAKGNYAYNNVVKFIDKFNTSYRILAMTATPASTVEGVQEIIDNLHISKAEVRTEQCIDICRYLKRKRIERFQVGPSEDIKYAIDTISAAIAPALKDANEKRLYEVRDPAEINFFTAMEASRRLLANTSINAGYKWAGRTLLQLLSMVGQCLRRLNIYGIRSFYSYFKEKYDEAKIKTGKKSAKSSHTSRFFQHPEMKNLMDLCEKRIIDPAYLGHEKLEIVISQVSHFFKNTQNHDSRVIIFSEFRESALDIVRAIEHQNGDLRPHIFIGQSKDSSKSEEPAGPKKKGGRRNLVNSESLSGSASSELAQSTGMSQKMQKETIRKFKAGEYNILVATSIGEEGLDIGEVDLIVCYDSTSSPIKNVQRMGRTGRNRDGKIILLFSGNEEFKFDKAMGGYEYIQQHIMNGNLIQLYEQNRIIPSEYTPSVEERLIEIPEENAAIKEEADDDEIIKIVTKYMTGGKVKAKTKAKGKGTSKRLQKQEKLQKKFFMPDNVQTGFQVASVVTRDMQGDIFEQPVQKRPKLDLQRDPDILDMMLDSDIESPVSEIISPNLNGKETALISPLMEEPLPLIIENVAPYSQNITPSEHQRKTPLKATRQPQLDSLICSSGFSRTPPASLGVKRRQMTVIDQLKRKQADNKTALVSEILDRKVMTLENPDKKGITMDVPDRKAMTSEVSGEKVMIPEVRDKQAMTSEVPDKKAMTSEVLDKKAMTREVPVDACTTIIDSESDVFSDDDDDEILALARRTQSGDLSNSEVFSKVSPMKIVTKLDSPSTEIRTSFQKNEPVSKVSQASNIMLDIPSGVESESLYDLKTPSKIITSEEWNDLYMNYYVPVDSQSLPECAIPKHPITSGESTFKGRKSQMFVQTIEKMENMTEKEAMQLIQKYKTLVYQPQPPLKEFINHD